MSSISKESNIPRSWANIVLSASTQPPHASPSPDPSKNIHKPPVTVPVKKENKHIHQKKPNTPILHHTHLLSRISVKRAPMQDNTFISKEVRNMSDMEDELDNEEDLFHDEETSYPYNHESMDTLDD
jgi:hypothetical protein